MILAGNVIYKGVLLFLFIIAFVSCTEESFSKFNIQGDLEGLSDSTYVYLRISDSIIDSTLNKNGHFRFKGSVSKTFNGNIYLKESNEFKLFWFENSNYTIKGKKGHLKKATIEGGKVQSLSNELNNRKGYIVKSMDSIDRLLSNENNSVALKESYISNLRKLSDITRDIEHQFIIDYPNSIVSAHLINSQKQNLTIDEIKNYYSLMNEETQNTNYGKLISEYINLFKNPQIGEKYVDFEQINQLGEKVKLSTLLGKYTLVDFWASWCAPCRKQNPFFNKLYQKYRRSGFQIVSVSLDENRDHWIRAMAEDKIVWPNVTDFIGYDNVPATIYGINGIPDNFLIDSTGIIIGRELSIDELSLMLKKHFK